MAVSLTSGISFFRNAAAEVLSKLGRPCPRTTGCCFPAAEIDAVPFAAAQREARDGQRLAAALTSS
jgi:hypothetical protein